MGDLEPITRNEKLWSGENLEPKTRREMYIRHLYDETQVIPDSPKTREEMFILKAGEELHDVTIEQLTATENGIYSEEGVAYSPVIVEVPEPTLISKNITANGTYTASDDNADGYSSVSVDVPLPNNAYLLQTIENESIATFTDGTDNFLKSLEVAIEPVQDLHGYDAPWVGGAGKNKLQVTGTTQTINGVTFTVNNDGTIIVNGTATADARFVIGKYILKAGSSVRLNGSPVDGSTSTIALGYQGYGIVSTANSDRVCDRTSQSMDWDNDVYIAVTSGYTANNLVFKPMIRLSSVTDSTFAPYENICPISGWDEVNVTVADDVDNPTTTETITIQLGDTYYGGKLDVVNGVLTVDWKAVNLNTLTWAYQSDYSRLYADVTNIIQGDGARTVEFINSNYRCLHNGEEVSQIHDGDTYTYGNTVFVHDSRYTDGTAFKNATTTKMVYPMATPQTIQLTPTIIKSLQGKNYFLVDSGKVIKLQYWGEVS